MSRVGNVSTNFRIDFDSSLSKESSGTQEEDSAFKWWELRLSEIPLFRRKQFAPRVIKTHFIDRLTQLKEGGKSDFLNDNT